LAVPAGAVLGVIGHTGSGKSTLLQLMAGLTQPTAGRVLLGGADLADKAVRRGVHARVGVSFQYPGYQLFATTVADDIAFAPRNAGYPEARVQECVRLAAQRVGLDFERYAGRSPFELSGGEQRRVALAGAVATDPEVLVLDEPMAGLDPAGRQRLVAFIEDYHASGHTVVIVTHDMDDVAQLATQVLVLNEGRAVLQGTPAQVFSYPVELRRINLGMPKAAGYAHDLNERGFSLPAGLLTPSALADALARELGAAVPERGDSRG
jgi:energy-coupling factor transport system ATP-binding protein